MFVICCQLFLVPKDRIFGAQNFTDRCILYPGRSIVTDYDTRCSGFGSDRPSTWRAKIDSSLLFKDKLNKSFLNSWPCFCIFQIFSKKWRKYYFVIIAVYLKSNFGLTWSITTTNKSIVWSVVAVHWHETNIFL